MGKAYPKERGSKTPKQKRRLKSSSNKYLRPGALAKLRNSKASTAKPCTDLGKKRVAVIETDKMDSDSIIQNKDIDLSPLMLSPINPRKQNILMGTPKTPLAEDPESESRLESLPLDLLVKVLCHLHHDQLRAVFHVSRRVRKAVLLARQFHFNYTTPDRARQEMLRTVTPCPTDRWPFVGKDDGKGIHIPTPSTPKAPRQGPRPPSRVKFTEVRQIAAVLFQEAAFSPRHMVPPLLSRPPRCKSFASNRALFYEEDLCQAVAQNKLS